MARIGSLWLKYTPQEFKQTWQSLFRTSEYKSHLTDNFDDFAVRSPYVGLTERIIALKRVTEEVTAFKEKIDQYYQVELNYQVGLKRK